MNDSDFPSNSHSDSQGAQPNRHRRKFNGPGKNPRRRHQRQHNSPRHSDHSSANPNPNADYSEYAEYAEPQDPSSAEPKPEREKLHVGETIRLDDLRQLPTPQLQDLRLKLPSKVQATLTNSAQLIMELGKYFLFNGARVIAEGVLDLSNEKNGLLRNPNRSFRPAADDIYIPIDLIKRFGLRHGHKLEVQLRLARPQDKFLPAHFVVSIEGIPAEEFSAGKEFDKLTPLFPNQRLLLENISESEPAPRVIDLIAPLGKGQRGLVVAPPRGGKTMLLKQIARSIRKNHPEVELMVLLLDERPEEVTDFEEMIDCPVYASTFDEPSRRHIQLADFVNERAKRLVEQRRDVVILLDSLTRLARGNNNQQTGGRVMSGGLGSNAMEKPRKFFGSARNVEEGGSLTIIATCLVETESRMDEVIFEEFKGTGNLEIKLDRDLAERRIFPAIQIAQSGTRNDERLYHPDEFARILELRRELSALPYSEALELLIRNINSTRSNAELLLRGGLE